MNLPLATAFISFYKVFYFTMLIEPGFLPPPSASLSIFPCICFPLRPLMILLESRSVTMFVYFLTFASLSAFTDLLFILCFLLHLFISLELATVEELCVKLAVYLLWEWRISAILIVRYLAWPMTFDPLKRICARLSCSQWLSNNAYYSLYFCTVKH